MKKSTFSSSDVAKLNSNKALKFLLQNSDPISLEKALNFVKNDEQLEKMQIELIKLQHWVIENKMRLINVFIVSFS